MNIIRFIIYPFLGAFLGYITNWIAITLLFRPRKKILGIQGLLEKRKEIIAKKAAEVVREYLFNTKELQKVMNKRKVENSINKLVDKTLLKFPSLIKKGFSVVLREITYAYFFDKNGLIKDEIMELAITDTEFEKVVIDKINGYDISEIEKIIKKASGTEMMFILTSGAVLGFIVGMVEAILPF